MLSVKRIILKHVCYSAFLEHVWSTTNLYECGERWKGQYGVFEEQ